MPPEVVVPLDPPDAWRRLGSVTIGRVGITLGSLPLILPMPFVTHDDELLFAVDRTSPLVHAFDHAVVAFEASGFHDDSQRWWTVLVRGTTHLLDPGHDAHDLAVSVLGGGADPAETSGVLTVPHLVAGGEVASIVDVPAVAGYLASSHRPR